MVNINMKFSIKIYTPFSIPQEWAKNSPETLAALCLAR